MANLIPIHQEELSMNSVFDAIYARRSTRNYSTQPVSENQIKVLIDAAIQAPSAMNKQPWAFLIIQNPTILNRISEAAKKNLLKMPEWRDHPERGHIPLNNPQFDIFYGATTLVVICAKNEAGFSPVGDCYLAAQNLMLAAQALGLSTCPIGFARDVLDENAWREELLISDDYDPVLPIIVGYATAAMPRTERAPARVISWIH